MSGELEKKNSKWLLINLNYTFNWNLAILSRTNKKLISISFIFDDNGVFWNLIRMLLIEHYLTHIHIHIKQLTHFVLMIRPIIGQFGC